MAVFFLIFYIASLFIAVAAMLAACISDFRTMTIPNRWSVVIALAFFPAFGAASLLGLDVFEGFFRHLIAVGIMFVITFVMFFAGVWGAGDSKLASALSLWLGLKGLAVFLLVMALSGLVVVVAGEIMRRWPGARLAASPEGSWPQRLKAGQAVLPYGIAIAAGGAAAFADLGYFNFFQIMGPG